jgi:hypothetical protein
MRGIELTQGYLDAVNLHFHLDSEHGFQVKKTPGGYHLVRILGPSLSESTIAGCLSCHEAYYYARGLYEGVVAISRGDGVYHGLVGLKS